MSREKSLPFCTNLITELSKSDCTSLQLGIALFASRPGAGIAIKTSSRIQEFKYVLNSEDGKRLIIKIKSNVLEEEIYDDFAKIHRKYKVLNRKQVGDYFFKEMEDMVNKLCDDFEAKVRNANKQHGT